jgi:hypothetical protein
MIYRYIYKITCTRGRYKDHYYFGQHTTDNLDDEYKGSGKKLRDYYKKHPNDYVKEIISFHNSQEELNQAEINIINKYLNDNKCLNIAEGGKGGCTNKGKTWKVATVIKRQPMSEETKKKISKANKGTNHREKGWHHSEYSKQKIGISNSIKNKGHEVSDDVRNKLSSLYSNTKYMTLDNHTVRAKENEINHYLELGYHFGRK